MSVLSVVIVALCPRRTPRTFRKISYQVALEKYEPLDRLAEPLRAEESGDTVRVQPKRRLTVPRLVSLWKADWRHFSTSRIVGTFAIIGLAIPSLQDRLRAFPRNARAELTGKRSVRRSRMKYETILYEKHDSVAKITTNRPRYKNAQSRVMIEEMDHAFAAANSDDAVRVIILAAAGDTFSSGHDLGSPEEKADMGRRPFPKGVQGEYALSRHLFLDTTLRWRDLDKPTIAQVQGMCIFGGWMFAAAMDLIVAADDARFLPALMQYFSIPWDIPLRKAKEVMFRSRFIGAEEAAELGFVNLVVPRNRLESETMALALEIAENDPFTLRMVKWAANSAQDAMGFSHSIRSAHSHYMVHGLNSFTKDKLDGKGFPKVMPGVARALKVPGNRQKED